MITVIGVCYVNELRRLCVRCRGARIGVPLAWSVPRTGGRPGASQRTALSTLGDDDAYEGGSVASGDPQSSLNYPGHDTIPTATLGDFTKLVPLVSACFIRRDPALRDRKVVQ